MIEAALIPFVASEAVKLEELAIVIAPTAVVFPTAPVKVTFPVPAVKLSGWAPAIVPSMVELNVMFLFVPLELNALVAVKVTALLNEISPLAVVMAAPVETFPAPSWEKDPPMLNAALGNANRPLLVNKSDPLFVVVTVLPKEMVEPLRIIPALPLVLTAPTKLLAPVDAFSTKDKALKLPLAVTLPALAMVKAFNGVPAPTLPPKLSAPLPAVRAKLLLPSTVLEKVIFALVVLIVVAPASVTPLANETS